MREVTIAKVALASTVRENLREHLRIYEAADAAFREQAILALESAAAEARDGGPVRTSIGLVPPQSHEDDYDTVLSMLNMEVGNVVVLDRTSYEQYVLDKWHWSGAFMANAAGYVGEHGEFPSNGGK